MPFNTTQAASLLTTYVSKKWIPALERSLQLQKFTTKVIIPPGIGKTGRVVTFQNPPGTTTPITEGTVGNAIDITTSATNVTIAEYGEFTAVPSLVDYAGSTQMREELVKRFTHGALLVLDTLVRNAAHASATPYGATTLASGSQAYTGAIVPAPASAASIIGAVKGLKDSFALGFRGIDGHPDGHYAAVIGTQAELDTVTELVTTRMYWSQAVTNVPGRMGQEKWVNGYIGSIYGTAVYVSQQMFKSTVSSTNTTLNLVLADGGVAAMAFSDMEPNIFVNTPSANSTDNPYRNFSSIAWHSFFGTQLNDSARVIKLYTAGN